MNLTCSADETVPDSRDSSYIVVLIEISRASPQSYVKKEREREICVYHGLHGSSVNHLRARAK